MSLSGHEAVALRDAARVLDSSGEWRHLYKIGDDFGPVLCADECLQSAPLSSQSPALFLLQKLLTKLGACSLSELAELLTCVGLTGAAERLLPPRPLTFTPLWRSCGAEDSSGRLTVPLAGQLLLQCEADARPSPRFQWLFNDTAMPTQTSNTLNLADFSEPMSGRYSCVVSVAGAEYAERHPEPALQSACVGVVHVKPRAEPPSLVRRTVNGHLHPPPQNTTSVGDAGIEARADTVLACEWRAWPCPQYHWLRDGRLLTCNSCTLKLGSLEAACRAGSYVCVAENSCGKASCAAFVVEMASDPEFVEHPTSPHSHLAVDCTYQLFCSAVCSQTLQVVWRVSVDDCERVVSQCDYTVSQQESRGLSSSLRIRPRAEHARCMHRVTCELIDTSHTPHKRFMSRAAVFQATFSCHSKLALIIGNSQYSQLEELIKVDQDVEVFRRCVSQLGFGTLVGSNVDSRRFWRMLDYLCAEAALGCYVVVFVAGHGFTHEGRDYLVPVEADRGSHCQIPPVSQCICLEEVERRVQRVSPAVLVMCADMCRSAGIGSIKLSSAESHEQYTRSVTHPPSAHRNVLRLFSTQAGQEAFDDGVFMKHLLQHLQQDITIQQLGLGVLGVNSGQFPIVEIAHPEKRGLLDMHDNTTMLDIQVQRRHRLQLNGVVVLMLESWSNCACDSEGIELRLTLTLSRVDVRPGHSSLHCPHLVQLDHPDYPQAVAAREAGDARAGRWSSWQCSLGAWQHNWLTAGCPLRLLVFFCSLSASSTPASRAPVFRTEPLRVFVSRRGLLGPCGGAGTVH